MTSQPVHRPGYWKTLVAVVTFLAAVAAIISLVVQLREKQSEAAAQATQIAKLDTQIAKMDKEIALAERQADLASLQVTAVWAVHDQLVPIAIPSQDAAQYAPTATAVARLLADARATEQALEAQRMEIALTQTAVAYNYFTEVSKEIQVPGNQGDGVRFDVPATTTYFITITDGAYSGWPADDPQGGMWRSIVHIYRNRPIEWGWRTWENEKFYEPINPDLSIGSWNSDAWTTQEQAAFEGKGNAITAPLQAGDYLIFVPVDEQTAYNYPAPNRGKIIIEISWTQ